MTTSHSQRKRAISMLVLATLFWGVSFPTIKALAYLDVRFFPASSSWFISALSMAPRFVFAAVFTTVFRSRFGPGASRNEVRQGVALGLFASAGMLLQVDGLEFTSASTSAFLTQFSAVLIPIWFAIRRRRLPSALVCAACLLVLVGVAILGHFDLRSFRLGRGECETLLSSGFFMGQILWVEKHEFAGNRGAAVSRVMFLVQAAILTVLAVASAPRLRALGVPLTSPLWLALTAALGLVCSVGAFTLMNTWQPRITSTEAGLIYCIEPIFASLFALFLPGIYSAWGGLDYPNERVTGSLVVGGGLIIGANALIQWKSTQDLSKSNVLLANNDIKEI